MAKIPSHPLSLKLRPIANNRYAKLIPGLVLFLGMMWWTTPLSLATGVGGQVGINLSNEPKVLIETKVSTQWPLKKYTLTQGFGIVHSGYDLAAPTGTRVLPIMVGVVLEVEKNWFGYGNMILVDHQNGFASRYAHLSQMWVKVGQEVDLNTSLGLVGSTGRSTGPHLHLEVMENGRLISPKVILGL